MLKPEGTSRMSSIKLRSRKVNDETWQVSLQNMQTMAVESFHVTGDEPTLESVLSALKDDPCLAVLFGIQDPWMDA